MSFTVFHELVSETRWQAKRCTGKLIQNQKKSLIHLRILIFYTSSTSISADKDIQIGYIYLPDNDDLYETLLMDTAVIPAPSAK